MIDISVIIPVYNKKDFLEKCIDSVLKSSLKNLEIVCIEDNSSDGSKDILKEIAAREEKVIVLENDKNYGVSYSRNRGIQYAKGKYIFFLDADDYVEQYALQIYFQYLEENHAQGCFIRLKDEAGKGIGIKNEYSGVYQGVELLDRFVDNDETFLYACGGIWQRKFLLEYKIEFQKLKIGEGGLFILEALLKAEKVVCSNYLGYCYVLNKTSTNQMQNAMQESAIGQAKQLIFMIKNLQNSDNNKEITHFLEWYIKKYIGGIKNLRLDKKEVIQELFPKEDERFLLSLMRGSYLEHQIQLDASAESKIVRKGKIYLYGAGYETLDAIRYCHQLGIEIAAVFVTSKQNNPDNIYGFHVREFDKGLIEDRSIPVLVTAHKKHQKEIVDYLSAFGIENIVCI